MGHAVHPFYWDTMYIQFIETPCTIQFIRTPCTIQFIEPPCTIQFIRTPCTIQFIRTPCTIQPLNQPSIKNIGWKRIYKLWQDHLNLYTQLLSKQGTLNFNRGVLNTRLKELYTYFKWLSNQRTTCPIHNGTHKNFGSSRMIEKFLMKITIVVSLLKGLADFCFRNNGGNSLNFQLEHIFDIIDQLTV